MTASLGSDGRNLAKSIDVSDAVISFSSYAVATPPAYSASTMQNPATIYQHIQETCGKRITTLDYLRKTWVEHPHRNLEANPSQARGTGVLVQHAPVHQGRHLAHSSL
jgi:hypothetical protein